MQKLESWCVGSLVGAIQRPRQRSPPLFQLRRRWLRVLYILHNSWPYLQVSKTNFASTYPFVFDIFGKYLVGGTEYRLPHIKFPFSSDFMTL